MVSYCHLGEYVLLNFTTETRMYVPIFLYVVDLIILLIPGVHLESCQCPLCPSTPCDHDLGEGPENP